MSLHLCCRNGLGKLGKYQCTETCVAFKVIKCLEALREALKEFLTSLILVAQIYVCVRLVCVLEFGCVLVLFWRNITV